MSNYKFSRMEDFLNNFPQDLLFYKNIKKGEIGPFKELNIVGMGGSGIVGRILSPFLKIKHNIYNNYFYKVLNDTSLNILISYSGNTEETLSFIKPLEGKNIITISCGGKLEEIALEKKIIHYKLPSGYPPRCALPLMFSTLSLILSDFITFKVEELDEVKEFLEEKKENFSSIEGECMDLAQKIYKRPLFIYTAYPYNSIAYRIKTQLNENSKHFVHIDFIPEMNHNEIEGLNEPEEVVGRAWVLFIVGKYMNPRNRRRIEETIKIIQNNVMGITVFEPQGENLLKETFYTIYFFDYLSVHLARLNKVDPFRIEKIERLKKALSN
ncbi:MAG: bifunctional phosphoglucose/phosphomannose isomerase [Candidatus Hydrothermales bacterium]